MIALLFVLGVFLHAPEAEAAGQSVTYKLTTLDGAVISEQQFGQSPVLLVFYNTKMTDGAADDLYSASFIASLDAALDEGWVQQLGLKVLLVGGNKSSSVAELKRFLKAYAPKLADRNLYKMRISETLMRKIFGTGTMDYCNCALVRGGNVLAGLTGVSHIDQCLEMIGEHLDTSGLYETVQITASYDYASAFDLLSRVNKERKAAGLAALKMDKDLLTAAMQRAAELSVLPSHVRPSAQPFYLIHGKVAWENIAVAYETAKEAMTDWMSLDEYKDYILYKDFKTLGVGAVKVNGVMCWTLLYGTKSDSKAVAKKADYTTDKLVTKYPKITLSSVYLNNEVIKIVMDPWISELKPGKTAKIKLHILSDTDNSWLHATLLNSKLKFTSSKTSVATVSNKGVITAVKLGTTNIKIVSKLSGTGAPALGAIKVSVVEKPVITQQPKDVDGKLNKQASFSVKATGGALKYTWYYRKPGSEEWKAVSTGGKKATYTFTPKASWNGNEYRCEVKNSLGTVYSDVVTLRLELDDVQPAITIQPQDAEVPVGENVSFSVKATGGNLTYQWYYCKPNTESWIAVSSVAGKNATYTLTTALRHDGYQYRCEVKNSVGTVCSDTVTLKLILDDQ